jgi:hypothetical protein
MVDPHNPTPTPMDFHPKHGATPIHIKPSHKGLFTKSAKAAGRSVAAEASAVLSNPKASAVMKKRAVFAQNARKWNHG